MRLTFFFSTSWWFTLLNFFNFRSQLQRLGSHKVVVLRFLVPVGFLCDHSSMEKYFWVRSFELMTIESSMHALSWLLPYMPNDQLLSLFIHELLQCFQPTTSDILVSWLILLPLILIDFIILSLSFIFSIYWFSSFDEYCGTCLCWFSNFFFSRMHVLYVDLCGMT